MADELDGIATFVAVAETKGFRAAGERLGVSHSAVSQSLRRLEERLGVPLVRRTTRSVHLTEAGEKLYASVRPALDEVRSAMAAVGELGDQPRGTLRVHTSSAAQTLIGESLLTGFLAEHPHVLLDLVVSDAPVDIVAEGFDAGIQLGEVIDKDMIAVPVTGDLRLAVVGAPSYFARRGVPSHPRELVEHDCLNWHPTPDAPPYRWEFTDTGRDFSVAVPARVLSTDAELNRRLAIAGLGVTLSYERHVREAIERKHLVRILEKFCAPFPGYYLYYPQRRHASRSLRALVDHLRGWRQAQRGRKRARQVP
ncbi:MAG TPA: LysR family transcriptional regulator [Gemmatimonadaceae bacterium]|nr:LysR family transcriptional regulator [Gemmatimonadaceae bacterium]